MCGGGSRRHEPLPTEDHQEPLVPLSDRDRDRDRRSQTQSAPPRQSPSQALSAQAQQLRALQQISGGGAQAHSHPPPTAHQPRRPLPQPPQRHHQPPQQHARQYNASQPESVDALTANWSRLSSSNVNENVLIKLAREQAANRAQMISEGMDAETASELACGYFEEMMETLDISDLIDRENKLYPKMLEGGKQIIRGGIASSSASYRTAAPPSLSHYSVASSMASAPSIMGHRNMTTAPMDEYDSDEDDGHSASSVAAHEVNLSAPSNGAAADYGLSPWQLEQMRQLQPNFGK